MRPTTRAFHDVMADAIIADGYEETLAPLVVFEWLYNEWATAVADRQHGTFLHREWITIHSNQQFDAFVAWLRDQLDRGGSRPSSDREKHIAARVGQIVKVDVDVIG